MITPLQDRVLVKRIPETEKSPGGIIIPESAKEKPIEGIVHATGSGRLLDDGTVRKLDVKKGDRVLINKYAGTEIKVDGVDYVMLREDEILATVE